MRPVFALLALLSLAGCAQDTYAPARNGPPRASLSDDLQACKSMAIDAYMKSRSHSGALMGGLLGGAIGGAIGGAMDAQAEAPTRVDIDKTIQKCMREKGYIGTSSGHN